MGCEGNSSGAANQRAMLAGMWDVKSPLRVIQQQQSSISSISSSSRAALISFLSPPLQWINPPSDISSVEAAPFGAPYWTQADLLNRHSGRFLKK